MGYLFGFIFCTFVFVLSAILANKFKELYAAFISGAGFLGAILFLSQLIRVLLAVGQY